MNDIYETITKPLTAALLAIAPGVRQGKDEALKLEIAGEERVLWCDLGSTKPYTSFEGRISAFGKGVLAASGVDIFDDKDFRAAYAEVSRVLHTREQQSSYR